MNESHGSGQSSAPSLGSTMHPRVSRFIMLPAHNGPFASREYPRFTESHLAAMLYMRGMTTMTEMRSLFEALGVLGVIVATGIILALLLQ